MTGQFPSYFLSHATLFALFDFLKSAAPAYHNLTPAPFAEGLRQAGAVLVDVRRPAEFAQGHLPGAVPIDVTAPDFGPCIAQLHKPKLT